MQDNANREYVKPALEDLGTLASRTESSDFPNADDSGEPAPSANPGSS